MFAWDGLIFAVYQDAMPVLQCAHGAMEAVIVMPFSFKPVQTLPSQKQSEDGGQFAFLGRSFP
jgi:hypothetical protein